MHEHARALLALILSWLALAATWLPTVDELARIALSVMGFVAAYYSAQYYRRNSK